MDVGHPRRIPFGIAPGTRHVVLLEFATTAGAAISQSNTTWQAKVHDAHTGAVAVTYTTEYGGTGDELVQFTAAAVDTATLDTGAAYELRIMRTSPGPDLILAGPILFPPMSTPEAA